MKKTKIIVAVVLLPAFIWLIGWAPTWLLFGVVMILGAGLGGWESAKLAFGKEDPTFRLAGTALSLLAFVAAASGEDQYIAMAVVGITILALLFAGLFSTDLTTALPRTGKLLFIALYPGLLAGYVIALKNYEAVFDGTKLVMMLFALVWINDAGAFFVGSAMGKRPLAPRISPKKTWEGTVGGFAAAVLLGALLGVFSRFTFTQGLFLGVTIGILGPLGDLVESALKRGAGVKDSGNLLPGHGGILDRVDSVIVCAPLLYYFVIITHYTELLRTMSVPH